MNFWVVKTTAEVFNTLNDYKNIAKLRVVQNDCMLFVSISASKIVGLSLIFFSNSQKFAFYEDHI